MSEPTPHRLSIALLCAVFAGRPDSGAERVNDLLRSDIEDNDALLYDPLNEETVSIMEIE